jgi:thioredoxin-related protein
MVTFLVFTGCAASVDKSEVEQSSNPVAGMHNNLSRKLDAEKNRVKWYSYEDALIKARKENKYTMVLFYATWCKWCKKMEGETFTDPDVEALLGSDFVSVKIDSESADRVVHEMRKMAMFELADVYGVDSFPTIWFLKPDGTRAKELKGYMAPSDFSKYLVYIKSGEYTKRDF